MSISILLVDDHNLFRSGVRQLLQREEDLCIVAEAADGLEGLKRAKALRPDVILLDLNMPGLSGLETLHLLTQDVPQSKVVILTVSEEAEELGEALRSGAVGYLTKNVEAETLVAAIRKAKRGEPVIAESMTMKLVEQFRSQGSGQHGATVTPPDSPSIQSGATPERVHLTAREREIMQCLARGESNKEIARRLDVAESTVKIHVQNILKKLNLSSRVQIAVYAVENGLSGNGP
ncbi:response regulator [Lautropia mirabilis]|jgi:probable nitrate/nitrite response regulator transcription regulator protein|nr:MAG: response regulator [Lautropia sp.]